MCGDINLKRLGLLIFTISLFVFIYFNVFLMSQNEGYDCIAYAVSQSDQHVVSSTLSFGMQQAAPSSSHIIRISTRIITTFFTLSVIFIGLVIFFENRNPSKTASWLLVLSVFPILGFFLYILMGQNFRKKKLVKAKQLHNILFRDNVVNNQLEAIDHKMIFEGQSNDMNRRLINLMLNNSRSPFTINNCSCVLQNGDETFNAIIQALKEAKNHIHLEYFIIKDDEIGRIIQRILIERAKAGVKVRLIYDGVGSWRLNENYLNPLTKAGVEIASFFPAVFPLLSSKINYRNHRKIIVVDGKTGFIGGLNIGDEYLGKNSKLGFWRDTHLRIQGEAVYMLQIIFFMDWYFITKEELNDLSFFPKLRPYGEQIIQINASGPDSDWESIMQAYFYTITSAQERIYIVTPYLVPGESIMTALKVGALSGVDVRIIVPGKPDHLTVFWASVSNFKELLEAGVRIYQYQKGFIHAKTMVVDGTVSSIGTANMDMRSFQYNFEVNAFLYDHQIAKKLEDDFLNDLEDSKEIILEQYLKRPLINKFKESSARLISPLL